MSGKIEKIKWYLRRLRNMSLREIAFRIREAVKRRVDSRLGWRLSPKARPFPSIPCIPGLRETLEAWDIPAGLLAEWEEEASRLDKGDFFLLGQQWPECSPSERWHLDPLTGAEWPRDKFCFKIDYRHSPAMGDIKLTWELNRLQYLQVIAALAFKRKDKVLARRCLAETESWIAHNPPFMGVNWSSGIELALRAVSILFVLSLLGEELNGRQSAKLNQCLELHGIWIARYISGYSSANNHRTAEGLGLFIIGSLCPWMPKAALWKETGWELLLETSRLQILDDGVGAEQSVSYTAVVVEMLLLGLYLARRFGLDIPPCYTERLAQAGEYLRWFTDSGGELPHIGDNDNARVIGVYRPDETYIRSALSCAAAMTERPDLAAPRTLPHLRQALFGVAESGRSSPLGLRTFASGGYTVARHRQGGRDLLLALDHGPLGYLSIAAHGHADALSIWLHLDDQPVLVDSGTYLYHSGGAWRSYFRSTPAHNTLNIQGKSSSSMSGGFNWARKARARLTELSETEGGWELEAVHDGYLSEFGALHYRKITFIHGSGFSVSDRLSGGKARQVEISYLLHPALDAVSSGSSVRVEKHGAPLMKINGKGNLDCFVHSKEDTQQSGWHSQTFNRKVPATRIVFAGMLKPGDVFTTSFNLVESE